MMPTVVRPLWRLFESDQLRAAAHHAREGGIAVMKDSPMWRLLGDAGPPGEDLPLLVDWAIRAVEAGAWAEIVNGVARGCIEAAISRDWRERVRAWVKRDAAFSGAVTVSDFHCERCAACCRDNEVVIAEEDVDRFRTAGRPDLLRKTTRKQGVRFLPLLRTKDRSCVHLGSDLRCGIYELRPNMCREFPAGSEQCLASREETWGSAFPKDR